MQTELLGEVYENKSKNKQTNEFLQIPSNIKHMIKEALSSCLDVNSALIAVIYLVIRAGTCIFETFWSCKPASYRK